MEGPRGRQREGRREGERGNESKRRKRHRWSNKKEARAYTWPKRNDGRTCGVYLLNKGLANRRRRWKLKRTHRRVRVYKNVRVQVAENIITVPFLGVSISVAGWRRARSRFLKTISFTGSGMCPSISSFWVPRHRERVLYPRKGRGGRSIPETS